MSTPSLKASFPILIMEKIQFNLQLIPKDFPKTKNEMQKAKCNICFLEQKRVDSKTFDVFFQRNLGVDAETGLLF